MRALAAVERLQAACESVLATLGDVADAEDVEQFLPVQRLLLPIADVQGELRDHTARQKDCESALSGIA